MAKGKVITIDVRPYWGNLLITAALDNGRTVTIRNMETPARKMPEKIQLLKEVFKEFMGRKIEYYTRAAPVSDGDGIIRGQTRIHDCIKWNDVPEKFRGKYWDMKLIRVVHKETKKK